MIDDSNLVSYLKRNNYLIFCFDSLNTTMDTAQEIAAYHRDDLIVIANSQIAGRGRNGRSWLSAKGNLYTTFCFNNIENDLVNVMPFIVALSIGDFFDNNGISSYSYKWPNDILIKNKKVAGILCQRDLLNKSLYVGIGINILSNIMDSSTCLLNHSDIKIDTIDIAEKLFNYIYNTIRSNVSVDIVLKKWLSNAYGIGKNVEIRVSENLINTGEFIGLDEVGRIKIKNNLGIIDFYDDVSSMNIMIDDI